MFLTFNERWFEIGREHGLQHRQEDRSGELCAVGRESKHTWAWVVTGWALFLAFRPYSGVQGDGLIYLARALMLLDPVAYAHDALMTPGPENRFSVFLPIYAAFLDHVPVEQRSGALLGLYAVAQSVWFLAFAGSMRCLLGAWAKTYPVLLAVAVLPGVIASPVVFSYADQALTARSFAEPLVWVALACALAGFRWHRQCAWLAAVLASIVHPLMGGVALVVLAWANAGVLRWGVWGGAVVAVVLALIGEFPGIGLGGRYDFVQWEMIHKVNTLVLISHWDAYAWARCVVFASVLMVRARKAQARERDLLHAIVGVAALGLVLAGWAQWTRTPWLLALQPWRGVWVMFAMGNGLLALWVWQGLGNCWVRFGERARGLLNSSPGANAVLALAGIVSVAGLLTSFDRRSDATILVESQRGMAAQLQAMIAPGATVLWLDAPERVTLWLRRPVYVAAFQNGGVALSRSMAYGSYWKAAALHPVLPLIQACEGESVVGVEPTPLGQRQCAASLGGYGHYCQNAEAPKWIVSQQRLMTLSHMDWQMPTAQPGPAQSFYLYTCQDLAEAQAAIDAGRWLGS